ncbi:hypothetical protein ACOSQ4_013776 [Xanthoceras sorbifolium]
MAVPGRRNGLIDDDENEPDNALFEEENELAAAAQLGDVQALRLALDNLNGSIDEPVEDASTEYSKMYLLLERGANLEAKDEDGAVPLRDACAGGFWRYVVCIFYIVSFVCFGNIHLQNHQLNGILQVLKEAGVVPKAFDLHGERQVVIIKPSQLSFSRQKSSSLYIDPTPRININFTNISSGNCFHSLY